MEHYIAEVVRRIRRVSGVKIRPTVVDGFHIANDLSHLVAETSDIVVMATRRRTFVSRTLLGSTLDSVLERRTAPVLHVPGYSCPVDLTARPFLRHALVPLDEISDSSEVIPFVTALNKLATGRQTLLRVLRSKGLFTRGDVSGQENESELMARSTAYLEEVARPWRHALPRARSRVVWTDASIAKAILKEAQEQDADCIVMTTRPRGRLKRLVSAGVFDRLIRKAHMPILVVKQRGEVDGAPSLSA
jgi:nucleotide-binding universal stress UspA family protein